MQASDPRKPEPPAAEAPANAWDWPGQRGNRWWRHSHIAQHRPPWWPEGEDWPPRDRRHWRRFGRHNPFFRRLGCLFGLWNLLASVLLLALSGLALRALGLSQFGFGEFAALAPAAGLLIAFVVVVAALSAVNLRRVSRPLDDILEASQRIAEGDYSTRVEEGGPSEVAAMARAFNSMASRLQSQDDQRRTWLSDVTHELRTPLTILQGNLEGLADGIYETDKPRLRSLLDEVQVLSRLTDDLRLLALAEGGSLRLETEPTDLALVIREVAAACQAQADTGGIRLQLGLEPATNTVEIDPARIRQVLHNLLFNALRYTPRGKGVMIALTQQTEEGRDWAVVSVQDEGPGIAPDDLPHVFDRYYKTADSRGMGLGLAIAKHIVEAHGGHISVSSRPGEGTRTSFSLPAESLVE